MGPGGSGSTVYMNLVGKDALLDEKCKLEKNGIEVGGWRVWKRVESGVGRGVRGEGVG